MNHITAEVGQLHVEVMNIWMDTLIDSLGELTTNLGFVFYMGSNQCVFMLPVNMLAFTFYSNITIATPNITTNIYFFKPDNQV